MTDAPGLTATQRGRMLRARRRAQGLVELKVWVSPNDQEKIKDQASRSVKKHLRLRAREQAQADGQRSLFDE